MSATKVIYPIYYRVIRRIDNTWNFRHGKTFYNPDDVSVDSTNLEERYDTTKSKVIIELFRINGGKSGYYLANLKDKQYYYCGLTLEDVRGTLQRLGIGCAAPLET